jgi:hypothetical protein
MPTGGIPAGTPSEAFDVTISSILNMRLAAIFDMLYVHFRVTIPVVY